MDMDEIVSHIEDLAAEGDAVARLQIQDTLRRLIVQLESPVDTSMRMLSASLEIVIAQLAADLGICRALIEAGAPVTVEELSKKSGAAPELLSRILRYMAGVDLIKEVGQDQFEASKLTHLLGSKKMEDGIYRAFNLNSPAINALPGFLKETGYEEITSINKTPFQKAFNTDLTCFEWQQKEPGLYTSFQRVMTAMQNSDWIPGFELLDREANKISAKASDPSEKKFLVDVGGGWGIQCRQLLQKYPNLHGRLVLEDLSEAIDKLEPIDGVTVLAQNALKEQTIQGAKFYYLRRVLHNWNDTDCVKILQQLAAAMSNDSMVLIDEVVVPEVGAHWHVTASDIVMMTLFAAKERTRKQWDEIAEKAGLRIDHVHMYNTSFYSSVIVLERLEKRLNGH